LTPTCWWMPAVGTSYLVYLLRSGWQAGMLRELGTLGSMRHSVLLDVPGFLEALEGSAMPSL